MIIQRSERWGLTQGGHGTIQDPSKATFSFVDEDHTLANAARFTLNQESVTESFT